MSQANASVVRRSIMGAPWLRRAGVVMLAGLLLVLVAALASDGGHSSAANAEVWRRAKDWTALAEARVAVGETRQDATAWLHAVTPPDQDALGDYDPQSRTLAAIVETVPVHDYVCDAWFIRVTIQLGVDDRVISRKVTTAGECL
ncbi:hypothetical protein ACO2Q3_16065 [Caulobacter sp. KR2-114]|uniref:hypothetical protein n=1 Tax=Caulobacter sp. KR2-114 TaxID=3400912 RepID=UPI003C071693